MKPGLPSGELVSEWLRRNSNRSRRSSWFASDEPRYEVGEPQAYPQTFFQRHVLFSVFGGARLLPKPALPSGSSGLMAFDGSDFILLRQSDDSLGTLFRNEGRSLGEGTARELAQLLCDVLRSPGASRHRVLEGPGDLKHFDSASLTGYEVDEKEFKKLVPQIIAPAIERWHAPEQSEPPPYRRPSTEGWQITAATAYGWMHDQSEVGVEVFQVDPEFSIRPLARRVLCRKVFSNIPGVRY